MNINAKPLTKAQQDVLKGLLLRAIKPFVHDQWDHVTDANKYFEVWMEMPGMIEQYASVGFTYHPEPLYWTVPMPNTAQIARFKAAGYGDDYKRFLWRYVDVPDAFWSMQEGDQIPWLTRYIEDSLKEDEQLRGT